MDFLGVEAEKTGIEIMHPIKTVFYKLFLLFLSTISLRGS